MLNTKYKELLARNDDDDRERRLQELRKKKLRDDIKQKREQEELRKRAQQVKNNRLEEEKEQQRSKERLLEQKRIAEESKKRPLTVEEARQRRAQVEAARNQQGLSKSRHELPRPISKTYSNLLASAPTKLDRIIVPKPAKIVSKPRAEVTERIAEKTKQAVPVVLPAKPVKSKPNPNPNPTKPKESHATESIWDIMNPGKSRTQYLARDIDSDEDDMEADADFIRREEQRAMKQAKLEDEREARLQAEHDQRKLKRRKL